MLEQRYSLHKDLGCYMPAFFNMELSFPFYSGINALFALSEQELAIFVHEYIHFLQDITTYVGLNNAYVYSEYIHAAVNWVYQMGYTNNGLFRVPIHMIGNYGNVELNRFVNDIGVGCLHQYDMVFPISVSEKKVKVGYPNPYVKHLTKVIIEADGGKKIHFGYLAIMESMAYLIERQITKGYSSAPDYPYSSAEMVVDKVYPEFGIDKLNVIALCDMSLQFSEPGKIFFQTLKTFREQKYIPQKPEEIVDFFYSTPCRLIGEDKLLKYGITDMVFNVGTRLKDYFNVNMRFESFNNVVHRLLGFGLEKRIKHRYFMIDLARGGHALKNRTFMECIYRIGSPIIRDLENNYWLIPPVDFSREAYSIEFFPAILEIGKLFENGNDICEMYEWCERSPTTQVDDRCIDKPWKRCSDMNLCPYAALWRHWNLGGFTPIFARGQPSCDGTQKEPSTVSCASCVSNSK